MQLGAEKDQWLLLKKPVPSGILSLFGMTKVLQRKDHGNGYKKQGPHTISQNTTITAWDLGFGIRRFRPGFPDSSLKAEKPFLKSVLELRANHLKIHESPEHQALGA